MARNIQAHGVNGGRTKLSARQQKTLDALIKRAEVGLRPMAARVNSTPPTVSHYIEINGWYESWLDRRTKYESEQKEARRIARGEPNTLEARITKPSEYATEQAKSGDWVYQNVVEYVKKKPTTTYSEDRLATLLTRYKTAKDNGKRLSLYELGLNLLDKEKRSISAPSVGRILETLDIAPLYWKVTDRIKVSDDDQERIKRSLTLHLSIRDLAYFVQLPYGVVKSRCQAAKRPHYHSTIHRIISTKIMFRDASVVYKAADGGLGAENIASAHHIRKVAVEYLLEERSRIEPEIIKIFSAIYPTDEIKMPYLVKK